MPNYYRGMPSREYWRERSQEVIDERWKEEGRLVKRIAKEYEKTMGSIARDVQEFIKKYGDREGISEREAREVLDRPARIDIQNRIRSLALRAKDSGFPMLYQRELSNLYSKFMYDRLSGLFYLMEARVIELTGSVQTQIDAHLANIYTKQHQDTYELLKTGGASVSGFVSIPEAYVTAAITMPWSGRQFSDRLWLNKNKLIQNMRDIITDGVATGKSVQKMSADLKKRMGQTTFNSKRIIQTETAHVATQGTLQGYKTAGIKQYEFMATEDDKTSKVCGSLSGQHFNVDAAIPGTNLPPMHPHCRSAVAPYFP